MAELFEQVLHHIEGTETEIQNWETAEGIKTVEFQSFGPDRWIEDVHERRRMMAIDCLAMVLLSLRGFDLEGERRIVESWAKELRNAVTGGEIEARDPVTLLALKTLPDGWEWLLSMADADRFIAARGMEWRFGEVALHLFNECERSIQKRRFPPWVLEKNLPGPTPNTAALAPLTPSQKYTLPVQRGAAQDIAILDAIKQLGLDPHKLPKNNPGMPGVKAGIRAGLVGVNPVFPKDGNQFDRAWERLRAGREIEDKS